MDKNQICNNCIMDTSDPDIYFNEEGICNHCVDSLPKLKKLIYSNEEVEKNLNKLKSKILDKKKQKYDCLIGLSGGVDSSYLCLLAKKMNLNALVVHLDNGWNSIESVKNIKKVLKETRFDYQAYVIEWEEVKDLQRSFIFAGVPDIEVVSDHAYYASLFKIAKENRIKFILSGYNFNTEHSMPRKWIWRKSDIRNIKDIHKKYGVKKLATFPFLGTIEIFFSIKFGFGPEIINLLDYINYNKTKAINELTKIGWNEYGEKHYESIFTKFYQSYILPVKFKIDKRKTHLSCQIRNNELSRDEALEAMKAKTYNDNKIEFEKDYVLRKLDISNTDFEKIMKQSPKKHSYYKTDQYLISIYNLFNRFIK